MIDAVAIDRIYQLDAGKKLVDSFLQELVLYTQHKQTKKIESCLHELNLFAKQYKMRPVYYDQHCLPSDVERYILNMIYKH